MTRKIIEVSFYIFLLIANSLITKYLVGKNIDSSFILFNRGFVCLLCVIFSSVIFKRSLIPKDFRIQVIRFFVAGISLFCIINSFKYIHAATVSLIQRTEILAVIIIGGFATKNTHNPKNYYSWVILMSVLFFLFLCKNQDENISGLFWGLGGTAFVIIGYFLIKKVSSTENTSVITLVSALGAVCFGASRSIYNNTFSYSIGTTELFLLILLGVFMFSIYYLTVVIYRQYSIENAQYFSLIAIFLTLPLESFFIGNKTEISYAIGLIIFSILVTCTVFLPDKKFQNKIPLPNNEKS